MEKQELFRASLIVTNAEGEYFGIRKFLNLAFYTDNFVVGENTVKYEQLVQIKADRSRLFLQYISADGKSCENYLKYNTFLPSTAPRKLRVLTENVSKIKAKHKNRITHANPLLEYKLAEKGAVANGLTEVVVYSSKVSFPPYCPVCYNFASKVTKFDVNSMIPSQDFFKQGHWLVPVCFNHKNLTDIIKVTDWSPSQSELKFSFKNALYAEAFLSLNKSPVNNRYPKERVITEKIEQLQKKSKYVFYQYYISMLVLGFLQVSDIQELKAHQSPFLRGLKYNLITFLLGWWSLPFGPVYTLLVLIRNFRGGADVTEKVIAVFEGAPMSALDD